MPALRCGTTRIAVGLATVARMSSSVIRPRGPLPPRVYWVRRLLVVGTAVALVVALGSLLTRGSDGSGKPAGNDRADLAAHTSSSAESSSAASRPSHRPTRHKSPKKPPLPQPSGPCSPADVVLVPVVPSPIAGSPIKIRLQVNSVLSPACTFEVSPSTVTLKITSGKDEIWTSRECPAAIKTQEVVARVVKPGWATIWWSGRRSDEGCTKATDWAMKGWYHVSVAPLSGEPEDLQFELRLPKPQIITKSPKASDSAKPENSPSGKPTKHHSPSGAVEPNGRSAVGPTGSSR